MAELECPNMMPKLITFLSSLLRRVAESNDADLDRPSIHPRKTSAFQGLSMPAISVQSYLERIFKYANCSNSCYIVAYVYLDRFTKLQPNLPINSLNVHRLLITSVMLSAKFMDDMYYNNAYYAKVGGISTKEMNFLELDFLFGVGFNLNVTPATFQTYCSYLQREMLQQQQQLINIADQESPFLYSSTAKSSKLHLCSNEDDSSQQQQQQQQQRQQQQLAAV